MLKAKELLAHMTQHLSDWLIMRRNPSASNGGKLLLGVAQEIEEINDAIKQYVDDFFIPSYVSKTHAIDYEHMRIHVGAISIEEIKVISPIVNATDCMQTFAKSCNYSYYENGHLYFKTAIIGEGDRVEYVLGDTLLDEITERVPIWNVFDEFAMYVGIERMDRENNERLLERILFQSNNPVNSSTEGIQNAIANVVGLQPDDVIIEKVDENNCYQNDFTGKTLFDQITELNRDIYRSKRWGIDYWHNDMEYVSYIPHNYDVKPGYYQDGIGDNLDLKAAVTRKDEVVHLEVKTYEKDEETITEYYQKYPIDIDTKLKLYKPQGVIEPVEVMAQIEAGTLTDVTDSTLNITYKAIRSACEKERVTDLIEATNCNINMPTFYETGHKYRFKVKSKTLYGSFAAKITIDGKTLIEDTEDFYQNELGFLSHHNIDIYANQLSYFSEHIGFGHEIDGFKLNPQSRFGRLVLPLKDVGGKILNFQIGAPGFDPIQEEALSYEGFSKSLTENAYISNLHEDPFFGIRTMANQIKFYIEGEAIVMLRNEESDTEYKIKDAYFETNAQAFNPTDHLIHIIPTDTTQVIKIKNIQFSNFDIVTQLEEGELINNRLPNISDNTLTITVSTFMSMAPTISFIYVGESLEKLEYVTKEFEYVGQNIDFLSKGDVLFTIEDITTSTHVTKEDNIAIITSNTLQDFQIDTRNYSDIEEIVAIDGGSIVKKGDSYFLRLEKNESCSVIIIKGQIIDYIKHYSIDELVNKKPNARYCVSPIVEGFIEILDYDMQIIQSNLSHLYGEYTVTQCDPYIPVFKNTSKRYETYTVAAPVDNFYLRAPIEKTYKAINRYKMYEEYKKDIEPDRNFYPLLPYNEILFFKVISLTEGTEVYFYNKEKEEVHGFDYESPYSIDLKSLNYHADFSLNDKLKQDYQEAILPIRLSKHIMLPNYVQNTIGDTLDLKEFIITPEEGIEVYYAIPQAEDMAIDPSFIRTEKFILNEDGIKKLACCQIHEIFYCGFSVYEENAQSTISDYELINQLGVIKFSSYFTKSNLGRVIYIHYTIKKPTMLILSTERLYNLVDVSYQAYKPTSTESYSASVGDFKIDNNYFKEADYVTVAVQEPGYIATALPKEGVIHIVESMPRNRIAVHKGFYYVDDDEYYMFGSLSDSHKEYKNDYLEAHDVSYMENGMLLHRQTENLIKNSAFECSGLTRLFSTDFSELQSINYFKRLSACEQINLWQACNTEIQLNDGLYGNGINFAPINNEEKHFIGMPIEQIGLDLSLSFWLKGDAVPVIYEQLKWEEEIHFTLSTTSRILHFEKNGYIRYINLPYNPDVFYYLALQGEGTIDDLILCEQSAYDLSHHIKNLNKVFMPKFPSEKSNKQRLLFNHQRGYSGTMQMLPDGEITPTSSMSFGYTNLLEKEWMKYAHLYKSAHIGNCLIPQDSTAYALTPIIKVSSRENIKEIIVRANCLSENNIPLIIYMGNSEQSLRPVASTVSDYVKIEQIEAYIQVRCNLSEAIYSLDISARYTEGALPETYRQNIFESEMFDLGDIGEYELAKFNFKVYGNTQVYVRSGKTSKLVDEYQQVALNEYGDIIDNYQLGNCRYVQFKIRTEHSCNLEYFDIIEK